MRIVHTADWHLCEKLGRIDRTADLERRVERVARYCEEREADALLIAGDLFSEQATAGQMAAALRHVNKTFAPFFARNGTILAITGNHDDDRRIDLVRSGMALAAPVPAGGGLTPGRMYVQNGLAFASLEATPGDRVQFAFLPYPTMSRYLEADDKYCTREEVNRLLQSRAAEWLAGLPNEPTFDRTVPTVLAAHFHVTGAEINGRYRIGERDDIDFAPGSLPTAWAYVALGHIHKPQALGGMPHVRYPGPLDRLDFGERHDDRGVLFAEVGRAGLVGEPEWLPLEPTPFLDIDLTDPDAGLPGLAEAYPEREAAIVRVTAKAGARFGRDDIAREIRKLFPRLHELKWADIDPPAGGNPARAEYAPGGDHRDAVRRYLTETADGGERAALLELAETFLREETP